jgi:hypothetical protein
MRDPANASLRDRRAAFAIDYLKSQGLSDAAARGAVAGSLAESQLDPAAMNKSSGAFGIGQWLGDRKAKLFSQFGPNATFDQQLRFLAQELKGGDRGGSFVTGAQNASQALWAYINRFMRPAAGAETEGDMSRGMAALTRMGAGVQGIGLSAPLASAGALAGASRSLSVNQTTNINVSGSDAHATARAVIDGQTRVNGTLLRNLKTAVV